MTYNHKHLYLNAIKNIKISFIKLQQRLYVYTACLGRIRIYLSFNKNW